MIITDLKKKLDNDFRKYYNVVLINGAWGIGKTYYLKEYLSDKKHVWISLFGINNLYDFKLAIYYELNKIGACIHKFIRDNPNRDIGISAVAIPIPNISSNIEKKIKKELNKDSLIIVIDDLERKSDNINIKDLLGFIESLTQIKNLKFLIIANEKAINEKNIYNDFKEKVINKTYNITDYSDEAIYIISMQTLRDNSIEKIISNEDFYNIIKKILHTHKIKNLRTLKKSIQFSKIFLQKIDSSLLKKTDKIELIEICFAVVVENCDNLCLSNENIEEHILKKYFNDTFINGKLELIKTIISIYNDEEYEENYKKIRDYYIRKYTVSTSEKDIFYCSEKEVEKRIKFFVKNNIKLINSNLDINMWFKEFNNLYPMAKLIGRLDLFDKDEIILAIEKYTENLDINVGLYKLIDRINPFYLSHKEVEEYYQIIKIKIANIYFYKLVDEIRQSMKSGVYDVNLIKDLFDNLDNYSLVNNLTRNEIIELIKNNDFFIPNINGDISEEQWRWCHNIWDRCSSALHKHIKEELYKSTQKIIKKYTNVGKYRIDSLNNQYNIVNVEVKNNSFNDS